MNTKQAAQVIRDSVTMDQILDLYGYRTKRGFMCCPFHGEREPSLKVYHGTAGWHCFGCSRGGSVIDFVMEHENCNFRTAIIAIDKSLHLGLMDPGENPIKATEQKRQQEWLDRFVTKVYEYLDALTDTIDRQQKNRLITVKILEEKRYTDVRTVTADEWTRILSWKDEDQYDEYRKERIEQFREEVAEWRRKLRRAA